MALTAGNPQIPLGTLNRLRGSVTFNSFPQLNITASFLGKEGISQTFGGSANTRLGQMVGFVNSPEPYQELSLEIHILKTQNLAALWEAQRLSSVLLGDFTVTTDATVMPKYNASNGALENIGVMRLNGEDAGYVLTVVGVYYINNALWSLT